MDKAEFFDRMGDLAVFMDERDTLNDHIRAIAPGAYCEIGGRFIDSYIKLLSESVGDHDNWIEWFVFENDMGDRAMVAGYDDKETRIMNLNDLWALIEEGNKIDD